MSNTKDEFNNFAIKEIIKDKEISYETGEYNEFEITTGLIVADEEEEDSSDDETSSKTVSLTTSIGMTIGVGGIVVGGIITLSSSFQFLLSNSQIGMTYASCVFEINNADYEKIDIILENGDGVEIYLTELIPTDVSNQYIAKFNDLIPSTTYYLSGRDDEGNEIDLGSNYSFTTLDVPQYDVDVDKSNYNKDLGQYNLSFKIDNPNNYLLNGVLVCENDETLNQNYSSSGFEFNFTLPTIYSSYRFELYQEGYLVGSTTFNDYVPLSINSDTLEIGLTYIFVGINMGDVSTVLNAYIVDYNDNNVTYKCEIYKEGLMYFVSCYDLLSPNSEYVLNVVDEARPTLKYLTYKFKTLVKQTYDIEIDASQFDINENNYTLSFIIDNPNSYYINAELICLNNETLNEYDTFYGDVLTISLPSLYSAYKLNLTQDGLDVGSINFSLYTPLSLISENISETSFEAEIDLGSVPIETNFSSFCYIKDSENSEELEVEIIKNEQTISLNVNYLLPSTKYIIEVRDTLRPTFTYFTYEFNTL